MLRWDEECHQERAGDHLLGRSAVLRPVRYSPFGLFFLNTSGIGAGAYNIPWVRASRIAYFGGTRSGTGTFFLDDTSFNDVDLAVNAEPVSSTRHVLDLRWGSAHFLGGKLKLVLIGSFTSTVATLPSMRTDRTDSVTNPNVDGQSRDSNSGGIGGGFVHQWDLPPSWGKLSYVQLAALYGWGLVEFDPSGVNLDKLVRSYTDSAVNSDNSPAGTFEDINPYNNSQRARGQCLLGLEPD